MIWPCCCPAAGLFVLDSGHTPGLVHRAPYHPDTRGCSHLLFALTEILLLLIALVRLARAY